jgi:hypothetical protein
MHEEHATALPEGHVLLAEVKLGEGHTARFVEVPDLATGYVMEQGNMDEVSEDSTLSARGIHGGMALDEIYVLATGDGVDWEVADELRDAQLRLEDLTAQAEADGLEQAEVGVTTAPFEGAAEVLPSSADDAQDTEELVAAAEGAVHAGVAQLSAALCAEPTWDWPGDAQWFTNGFCDPNTDYCKASQPSHTFSTLNKYLETTFLNQSHCSNAKYEIVRAERTCFFACWYHDYKSLAFGGLAPRNFVRYYSAASSRHGYWAKLKNDTGNFTALAVKGYN